MKLRSQKGFTLVELLIVVAIIGVLATVGVPTYRKMVQKAKKSEAKVALGGLYTSEIAFYAEYSTYGNNIDRIGFEMAGAGAGNIYTIGFPTGTCVAQTIVPDPTVGIGLQLNAAFPGYYPGGGTTADADDRTFFAAAANVPTVCLAGTITQTTFTASATGRISPNAGLGTLSQLDQWSMTQNRVLSNTTDGVL